MWIQVLDLPKQQALNQKSINPYRLRLPVTVEVSSGGAYFVFL